MSTQTLPTQPGAVQVLSIAQSRPAAQEPSRHLPLMDPNKAPQLGNAAAFVRMAGLASLEGFADALQVTIPTHGPDRFKSIPSPWARLLYFDHALFNQAHPAHRQVLDQWRGLLGLIALQPEIHPALGFELVPLPLQGGVLADVRALAPDPADTGWQRIGVITAEDAAGETVAVGGVSPLTLVFTGISRAPDNIDFVRDGRFTDPVPLLVEQERKPHLALLETWLATVVEAFQEPAQAAALDTFLGTRGATISTAQINRANEVVRLLKEWRDQARESLARLDGSPPRDFRLHPSIFAQAFPGAREAMSLKVLTPIEDGDDHLKPSDLKSAYSDHAVDPGNSGVILDRHGRPFTGVLWLKGNRAKRVESGRFQHRVASSEIADQVLPDLSTCFQPALIEIVGASQENSNVLRPEGSDTAFLYPVSEKILDHLSVDQVIAYVRAEGGIQGQVDVRLTLPVQNGLSVQWTRTYRRESIRLGKEGGGEPYFAPPEVAVWPDFVVPGWEDYFYFLYQNPPEDAQPLTLAPIGVTDRSSFTSRDGRMTWGRTTTPLRAWRGTARDVAGMLFTRLPQTNVGQRGRRWKVSIDFGSTHTRAFALGPVDGDRPGVNPITICPRALPLISWGAGRLDFYFFPARGSGTEWQELRSAVRIAEDGRSERTGDEKWLPSDGVILWNQVNAAGQVDFQTIKSRLKWHQEGEDEKVFRSYISQLCIAIAAEAAAQGATIDEVRIAYPSVFPNHLADTHQRLWSQQLGDIGLQLGFRCSEAAALAAYTSEARRDKIEMGAGGNLEAIDIGGSTSDLAVWAGNSLHAADSIRLAGDILTRLVERDPTVRKEIAEAARRIRININWHDNSAHANALIFQAALHDIADREEQSRDPNAFARALNQGSSKPGRRVIAHAGYLYAVVSYLMGLMVRRAGLVKNQYNLVFAGRGSQFLPWLNPMTANRYADVPTAFFQAGLGSTGAAVKVFLPEEHVKREVGGGLLAPAVEPGAAAPPIHDKRVTFMGEDGFSTGSGPVQWSDDLTFARLREIRSPDEDHPAAGEFKILEGFVRAFDSNDATRAVADALGLDPAMKLSDLRRALLGYVFEKGTWRRIQQGQDEDHTLLEPLFVPAAKHLLERVTKNLSLFDDGWGSA